MWIAHRSLHEHSSVSLSSLGSTKTANLTTLPVCPATLSYHPVQLFEGLLLLQGSKGFRQGAQPQQRVLPNPQVAAVAAEDASECSNDSGSERRSSGRGRRKSKPNSWERKLRRELEVSKKDSHGCMTRVAADCFQGPICPGSSFTCTAQAILRSMTE